MERYDNQTLKKPTEGKKDVAKISYEEARKAISILKSKNPDSTYFGNEKDSSFDSSLNVIFQTFDGIDLYPSIEEKAANLLCFLVKNHSFSDGNKRIAAYLFILFLDKNGLLYLNNDTKLIDENTLVAITLMIAQSAPTEKDMMINVLINLMRNE